MTNSVCRLVANTLIAGSALPYGGNASEASPVLHKTDLRDSRARTMLAIMNEGVKRERRAYEAEGAADEAEALAKLLEECDNSQIETRQEQSSPEALTRQKTIDEFTQRGEVLRKEIAELEETLSSGIKVEPAGGAYDAANDEYASAMERAFKGLLEAKKGELHFINTQLGNLNS
jgi:hypothetical protein